MLFVLFCSDEVMTFPVFLKKFFIKDGAGFRKNNQDGCESARGQAAERTSMSNQGVLEHFIPVKTESSVVKLVCKVNDFVVGI